MVKDPWAGCLALEVANRVCAWVLCLSFKTVRVPQRERDWPKATQGICVRTGVSTRSPLPTSGGHSWCVVLRTLLSW